LQVRAAAARFFRDLKEPYKSTATYRPEDQHCGVIAAACNHPNCLVLPFGLQLIRLAA
jgi:hypothetical protein